MGLFSVREARHSTIEDGIIPIRSSGHYTAGIALTTDSVSTHSAVWRCKNVYVDLLSTLPFSAYRDTDGVPVMLGTQPPVVDRPSVSTDKIGWVAQVVESLIMRGNVWGFITSFGANGWPTNVEILHPDAVTPRWDWRSRELEVRVFGEIVDPARLWHRAINMTAGSPLGMSTIEAARTSIGVGIAAQRYGSAWFTEGGHPSSLLSTDQALTAEQAAEMKERWRTMVREGSVAVLSQGMDYKPVALSPADAQFLESIDASGQDVCRFFKLPPETAGYASGESMTYSNVESQWLNLLIASLNPVLTVVEKAWSDLLPRPQYVQANRDALLRMTTIERYKAHALALGNKPWKGVDDVRVLEELAPLGGEYATPAVSPDPAVQAPTENP
jgi:HK97 family phage portal protein